LVSELVAVAEAHEHGQSWAACGLLHTARGHQGGSHVVVVELAVVAVVAVMVVAVALDVTVVGVAVAQEHGQTWKVSVRHATRAHHAGSQTVVVVRVELVTEVVLGPVTASVDDELVAVAVLAVVVAHLHGHSSAAPGELHTAYWHQVGSQVVVVAVDEYAVGVTVAHEHRQMSKVSSTHVAKAHQAGSQVVVVVADELLDVPLVPVPLVPEAVREVDVPLLEVLVVVVPVAVLVAVEVLADVRLLVLVGVLTVVLV